MLTIIIVHLKTLNLYSKIWFLNVILQAPGSEIRYEVSGKEKAPTYFLVDPESGLISVKDDLRKEPDSEYRVSQN